MMAFLWGLWAAWKSSVIKWAIYVAAGAAFIGTIWFKGYRTSTRKWQERQREAKVKQLESKAKINEKVKSLNDKRLDDALSKWMRD